MQRKKLNWKRFIGRTVLGMFVLMNLSAMMHAYRFTHFSSSDDQRSKNPEDMGMMEKLNALFLGASLPRPKNTETPQQAFEHFYVGDSLSCWRIPADSSKPTVLLFHGYGNRKSGMLDRAEAFHEMGYNTVLMDFAGGGDSKGNTCTIGYKEADQIKQCYDAIKQQVPEDQIILFGNSMGAASITRCMAKYPIQPKTIILECPFGSLFDAAGNRFDAIGLPRFPLVHLLILYGGLMNGFWAFDYEPSEYARSITRPCLLLTGGQDERVHPEEGEALFAHLAGPKKHIIYPEAKHESYLNRYRKEWMRDVDSFIQAN